MTPLDASAERRLSLGQQWLYALGNFGVAFSPTVVSAWLGYFYIGQETADGQPLMFLAPATFSVIWFSTQLLNAFTDPVVGYLSDRTRSRWGRRKPYLVIGAPFLALSFFFLWTPATPAPSTANAVILFCALFGFWFFYTVVVAPYLALLPEITPFDRERVRISAFMGLNEVVGTIAGNLAPPLLAALLATGALFLSTGYQVMGFTGAVALVAFFALPLLCAKETYRPPAGDGGSPGGGGTLRQALREFGSVFRNQAFIPYVIGAGFYRIAVATIVFITPFIATKILGSYPVDAFDLGVLMSLGAVDEPASTIAEVPAHPVINWELAAGYLMMLVLVGAALCFPLVSWLTRRVGKRTLYILALTWLGVILILFATVGIWPFFTPLVQALILFSLATFPLSIALVIIRPILAEVIDLDAQQTGLRREGIYNGMEGLIQKTGAALGPGVAGLLFQWLGSSSADNLGIRLSAPIAGVCLLAAALAFTRYPIRK